MSTDTNCPSPMSVIPTRRFLIEYLPLNQPYIKLWQNINNPIYKNIKIVINQFTSWMNFKLRLKSQLWKESLSKSVLKPRFHTKLCFYSLCLKRDFYCTQNINKHYNTFTWVNLNCTISTAPRVLIYSFEVCY